MSEKNMANMTEQQLDTIKQFLKDAWCIDGEVEFIKEPLIVSDGHFILTDSKRGKFAISWKAIKE